jgi:hypothetical protein
MLGSISFWPFFRRLIYRTDSLAKRAKATLNGGFLYQAHCVLTGIGEMALL